jgi:hypothetical protein
MLIFVPHSISITFIYPLASKTNLLDDDSILWFVLMLMVRTNPLALKMGTPAPEL